ncbi:hypothetical protein CUMW_243790 [Citrus unshiu]|uniref:Uncharacterized protein n=1 Tax=Citrus unshiu TaxID=55188 RepID=A0A2H5QME0_CITUN|nr:hypothetical protein CUMW_243790 [Citrus unshiu]
MVSRLSSRLQSLWPTLKRSSLSPLKHTFQTQASHLCLYKTHFSHLTAIKNYLACQIAIKSDN